MPNFDFTYDGSTIAAYAPNNNVYSISKAPDTIDAMLPFLEKASGIRFASADLLFTDPYAVLTKGLSSAVVVGSDVVQGEPCEHLAFRAPGVKLGSLDRKRSARASSAFGDHLYKRYQLPALFG